MNEGMSSHCGQLRVVEPHFVPTKGKLIDQIGTEQQWIVTAERAGHACIKKLRQRVVFDRGEDVELQIGARADVEAHSVTR